MRFCSLKKINKLTFAQGNVIVTGLRGTGKDMLMSNVISRIEKCYISNVNYHNSKSVYIPLDLAKLDIKNDFNNFIKNDVVKYDYPYPERCNIYISDAGVYFPSQDERLLCRQYPTMPFFQALSRHLGNCNFHCNVQNLNRLWDKIREQADIYIRCESCRVIGSWVFQSVYVYDKYQSCLDRVKEFVPLRCGILASRQEREQTRVKNRELKTQFEQVYGSVNKYLLCYRNKSAYDTRLFKSLLSGGKS